MIDGPQIVRIIGQVTPIMPAPATPPPTPVVPPDLAVSAAGAAVATVAAGYVAAKSLPTLLPLVWERQGTVVVFSIPPGGDACPCPAGDGTYRLPRRWWGVPILSLAGPGLGAASPDGGRTWQPTPSGRWEPEHPVPGRQVRLRLTGPTALRVNDGWHQEQTVRLPRPALAVRARVVAWPQDVPGLWLWCGEQALRPWRRAAAEVRLAPDQTDLRVAVDHVAAGAGRWRGGRLVVVLQPSRGGGEADAR